jgi:hypothetical protein
MASVNAMRIGTLSTVGPDNDAIDQCWYPDTHDIVLRVFVERDLCGRFEGRHRQCRLMM